MEKIIAKNSKTGTEYIIAKPRYDYNKNLAFYLVQTEKSIRSGSYGWLVDASNVILLKKENS